MKYILGIDTTFHSCGVGLIDEKGSVLLNEKIDIDFGDQYAKRFFNFHNRNVLSLVKPIFDKYEKDIFLVSASCEDGPFHAMPVGAIVANSMSYLFDKNIVGVNHEIAHMHANWLDRNEKDFSFPIISLNISGAHSNIYLIKDSAEPEKISEIIWREDPERFGGLGALFEDICASLDIKIKKGGGGICFEKLASLGEPKFKKEFEDFSIRKKNGEFCLVGTESGLFDALKSLEGRYSKENGLEKFQRDVCASLSEILFNSLVDAVAQVVKESGAQEIHLAGGVALDKALNSKMATFCEDNNFNFKFPLKPEYCRDNAAMVAISGYFKWKYPGYDGDKEFLTIEPAEWYYKYYTKRYCK